MAVLMRIVPVYVMYILNASHWFLCPSEWFSLPLAPHLPPPTQPLQTQSITLQDFKNHSKIQGHSGSQ